VEPEILILLSVKTGRSYVGI